MKRHPNYHDDLIKDLKNRKTAIGYLNAALRQGDKEAFLLGLKDGAEAWGGLSKLARAAHMPRISLYRMLSENGNPEMESLGNVLKVLGFRLSITEGRELLAA
jgi:probable addiction module antidote protein